VSTLDALLPAEAGAFLETIAAFARNEIAPHVLGWDAAGHDAAPEVLPKLYDLGLGDLMDLEEVGTEAERMALLFATGRALGRLDAGPAMAAMTAILTTRALGRATGFGFAVPHPAGRSTVGLTAGQPAVVLVAEEGEGGIHGVPSRRQPLLGLRAGGGRVAEAPDPAGEAVSEHTLADLRRDLGAAAVAVAIGSAEGALETAMGYAAERYQGGTVIAEHPAVRQMLAAMRTQVAHAEILLVHLLHTGAEEAPSGWGSFALSECEAAAVDGVQVLGGYGYMQEYGQEKRMRDIKSLRLLFGTP